MEGIHEWNLHYLNFARGQQISQRIIVFFFIYSDKAAKQFDSLKNLLLCHTILIVYLQICKDRIFICRRLKQLGIQFFEILHPQFHYYVIFLSTILLIHKCTILNQRVCFVLYVMITSHAIHSWLLRFLYNITLNYTTSQVTSNIVTKASLMMSRPFIVSNFFQIFFASSKVRLSISMMNEALLC